MLGYQSLGEIALGELKSGNTAIALSARIMVQAKAQSSGSFNTAIAATAKTMAEARVQSGFAIPARITTMTKARAPGGVAIPPTIVRAAIIQLLAGSAVINVNPSKNRPFYWASNNTYWRGTGA